MPYPLEGMQPNIFQKFLREKENTRVQLVSSTTPQILSLIRIGRALHCTLQLAVSITSISFIQVAYNLCYRVRDNLILFGGGLA
jgi:hypothetical protein